MLKQLTIRNFAIIEDLSVEFESGFNVITGETGAGKSIIIDALSLLLGERANSSMVRFGTTRAFIEGVFILSQNAQPLVESILGGPIEESILVVNREIDVDGRSSSRLNGRITTIATIKEIMQHLVDIHSQHDTQYLLDNRSHLPLLDAFGDSGLQSIKSLYTETFLNYQNIKNQIESVQQETLQRDQLDFFQFQFDEITQAQLQEGELETLEIEQKRIQQYEKFADKIGSTLLLLKEERGAIESLYLAKRMMESVQNDPLFKDYVDQLADLHQSVQAIYESIKSDFESIDFDPLRMQQITERIFVINRIKRKYGSTYADIQATYEDLKQKINRIIDRDNYLNTLVTSKEKLQNEVRQVGHQLTDKRREIGKKLAVMIAQELKDLFLPHTAFDVSFEPYPEPLANGLDRVEFLVSVNKGQPLKPLAKVASGGEISRFMLGLKVVFNSLYHILTMVYDEVDSGVSGQVARAVGLKMVNVSKNSQVLCITHLPQVAALASHHFYVNKVIYNNSTITRIVKLTEKERVMEVAKMLSGNTPTPAAITNAEELIKQTHE